MFWHSYWCPQISQSSDAPRAEYLLLEGQHALRSGCWTNLRSIAYSRVVIFLQPSEAFLKHPILIYTCTGAYLKHVRTRVRTIANVHIYTCVHTHTNTHTRAHVRAHTHTHTSTGRHQALTHQACSLAKLYFQRASIFHQDGFGLKALSISSGTSSTYFATNTAPCRAHLVCSKHRATQGTPSLPAARPRNWNTRVWLWDTASY